MSRTSRMLLVVVLVATGSVWALSYMAQRYSKMLSGGQTAARVVTVSAQADREIVAFLEVRERVARAVSEAPPGADPHDIARQARARSLQESTLGRRRYDRLEQIYGAWLDSRGSAAGPYAAAFARHRERLARTDAP